MQYWGTLRRATESRITLWFFLTLTLLLGIVVAKDYGVSWDEKSMIVLGEEAFEFVTRGEPYPVHEGIRYHGAYMEIMLHAIANPFHVEYARHFFALRHAVSYVVFWAGMLPLYVLAMRHFRHRGWALFVLILYFISPRQFGHAFVNTRDIPAMVLFLLSMATLLAFLETRTVKRAVLHGIACGMLLALRVGGLFVPIYVVLFLGIELLREYRDGYAIPWKKTSLLLAVFFSVFALSTVIFWPLLWEQPIGHFLDAMGSMTKTQNNRGILFYNSDIDALWLWIPIHFLTKTPLLYIALFGVGIASLVRKAFRNPLSLLSQHRDLLLYFTWFLFPVLIVIILRAPLFDEWRHVYFIYPAVLLLAAHGLRELWKIACTVTGNMRAVAQSLLIVVPAGCILSLALWMVRYHPLQYVYFSIPSRYVEYRFGLDYWGLSYRQGFEWILKHDTDRYIPVTVTSSPGWENLNALTREERSRLLLWKKYPPKYILDNFTWQSYKHTLPESTKVHAITVSGMEVLGIYRNPEWVPPTFDPKDEMETEEVQMWFDKNNLL